MRSTALSSLVVCSALVLASAPLQANEKIGVSAAVKGDVYVRGAREENQRRAVVNEDVKLGDEVDSKKQSALQILLLDETVFTVGADCLLTIDEFVYDPSAGAGRMAASVAKGTFRFVTGRIGANEPQDVSIKTPTATIGIRGTIIETTVGPDAVEIARMAGLLGPDDEFDPEKATIIVLRGPGPNHNSLNKDGSVEIEAGGTTQSLTVSATAVFIPFPGAEPTDPFVFTPEMDALISRWLRSQPTPDLLNMFDEDGNAGSGDNLSGQSTAAGRDRTNTNPPTNGNTEQKEVFPRDDAEDEADDMEMVDMPNIPPAGDIGGVETGVFNNIGDEISTFELAATAGSVVSYAQYDVPMFEDVGGVPFFNENNSINVVTGPFFDGDSNEPDGLYDFVVTVDPNNRTYKSTFTFDSFFAEASGTQIAEGAFGTGNAYLNPLFDAGVTSLTETGLCDGGGQCDTRIDFLIVDGNPLGGAAHSLAFTEDTGEGPGTTIRGAGSTSAPPLPAVTQ